MPLSRWARKQSSYQVIIKGAFQIVFLGSLAVNLNVQVQLNAAGASLT